MPMQTQTVSASMTSSFPALSTTFAPPAKISVHLRPSTCRMPFFSISLSKAARGMLNVSGAILSCISITVTS